MTDDKWFIRGISADLSRKVTDIARRDRRTVGAVVTEALTAWLDRQPDVTDEGDGHQSLAAAIADLQKRVARLEAKDATDSGDMTDKGLHDDVGLPVTTDETVMPDTADTLTTEPPCPTGSPVSDTGTPLEAAGESAGVVDAASAVAGAHDSTNAPGATGAARKRLAGDAKAERAADIKRRLAAGESKPDIMTALGISMATLNRALAE